MTAEEDKLNARLLRAYRIRKQSGTVAPHTSLGYAFCVACGLCVFAALMAGFVFAAGP